jgi:hypothetical protein
MAFNLFKRKPPKRVVSSIVFDEAYCHSAGKDHGGQTYELPKDTTEIQFRFPDFDAFWKLYVAENPYLDPGVLPAYEAEKAIFVAMIVDDKAGEHMYLNGILDNVADIEAPHLQEFNAKKPLETFDSGVIAWGFYFLGELQFNVIWATMYRSS